jgi:hypothetical protein
MKRVFLMMFACVGLVAAGGESTVRGYGGRNAGGVNSARTGGTATANASRSGPGGTASGSHERTSTGNSGSGFNSFSGTTREGGSYSGARTTESSSGAGGRSASGSYDRTYTDAAGGSVSTSGSRSASGGGSGGATASGNRNTTATTAGGQTYSANRQREATASGGQVSGTSSTNVQGPGGSASRNSAFEGNRYSGNMSHYTSVYGANGAHSTAYWSPGHMNSTGGAVRAGYANPSTFNAGWYSAHPSAWSTPSWRAGAAWSTPAYPQVAGNLGLSAAAAPNYAYGSSVVYQGNNVYVEGQEAGTVQQYAEQATAIAAQGQAASPPQTDDWQALGVFALVQGNETNSNTVFQLAVNKDGLIRGNYYDGATDATTDVYGSVDKKTQRAAWTIGKKKDRVFEAGVYNLTQPECPCLLHLGSEKTDQLLLVRLEQPQGASGAP